MCIMDTLKLQRWLLFKPVSSHLWKKKFRIMDHQTLWGMLLSLMRSYKQLKVVGQCRPILVNLPKMYADKKPMLSHWDWTFSSPQTQFNCLNRWFLKFKKFLKLWVFFCQWESFRFWELRQQWWQEAWGQKMTVMTETVPVTAQRIFQEIFLHLSLRRGLYNQEAHWEPMIWPV